MNRSFHLPQITRRDQHRTDRATESAKTPWPGWFLNDDPDLHRRAIVMEPITPNQPGRIKYQGTWWTAISQEGSAIPPQTVVMVVGRVGLTLVVRGS